MKFKNKRTKVIELLSHFAVDAVQDSYQNSVDGSGHIQQCKVDPTLKMKKKLTSVCKP
jgi:hypothetical protein